MFKNKYLPNNNPFAARRDFLFAACGLALTSGVPHLLAQPRFHNNPFTLGVASGYPQPDGIVLWTRLAPDALNSGGMPDAALDVSWEIADSDSFRNVLRKGVERAAPELAHSVHAEISGLQPARVYWYRFHAGAFAPRPPPTRHMTSCVSRWPRASNMSKATSARIVTWRVKRLIW
jgi:alkaline phosphatase D